MIRHFVAGPFLPFPSELDPLLNRATLDFFYHSKTYDIANACPEVLISSLFVNSVR